jgi:hypothetical protein
MVFVRCTEGSSDGSSGEASRTTAAASQYYVGNLTGALVQGKNLFPYTMREHWYDKYRDCLLQAYDVGTTCRCH